VKLQTMGHFIFGLPGETRQTAQRTIDFMLSLGLDYMQAYCAVPYPKTEFGKIALERGWVSTFEWAKYDFGGDSIVNTDKISAEETTYYRKKAFRSFYFRPMYAVKKVITNVSIKQIFKLSRFLEWMGLR
jgi:anaerobic magnesium-protoporphyrin IX monomethyl ester cyclase